MTPSKRLLLALAACGAATTIPRAETEVEAPTQAGFVSYPITYKERIIPQFSKRQTDTNVPLYNVSSVSYLIALSVGTPGQPIKVAIDTGSDELWVNPDCTSNTLTQSQSQECRQNGQYRPSGSSSARRLSGTNNIPYGKGEVDIQYYTDNIHLPNSDINLTNVQFGVATQSEDLNEGILGLAYGNGKNQGYNNFVDALFVQNVTASRAFSIALGSVDANNGGVIIFGGVDTKKFTGKLGTIPILGPQNRERVYRYWANLNSVEMTKNGAGGASLSSTAIPVVVDSGSSLSYLPTSVVSRMSQELGGRYDSRNELYLVPCSQRVNTSSFDFNFGGTKISVPWWEFIWNVDGQNCVLGAMPVDSGSTALLGDTFMRAAYVVFDQTTNNMYMAPYANCGQNEQKIPSGGAGNLTGECNTSASGGQQGENGAMGGKDAVSVTNVWLAAGAVVGLQLVTSLL